MDDDRNLVEPGDRVLLIVEDDATFARILVDMARSRGIKAVVALRGSTAVSLAREFQPGAITLDLRLPDMSGWTLLDSLKHDARTAHIPVHIISGHENNRRGFALGAVTCIPKDASHDALEEVLRAVERSLEVRKKSLLLIAENDVRAADIRNLLGGEDLEIVDVPDLKAASQSAASAASRRRGSGLGTAGIRGDRIHRKDSGELSSAGSTGGGLRHPQIDGPTGRGDSPLRPLRPGPLRPHH